MAGKSKGNKQSISIDGGINVSGGGVFNLAGGDQSITIREQRDPARPPTAWSDDEAVAEIVRAVPGLAWPNRVDGLGVQLAEYRGLVAELGRDGAWSVVPGGETETVHLLDSLSQLLASIAEEAFPDHDLGRFLTEVADLLATAEDAAIPEIAGRLATIVEMADSEAEAGRAEPLNATDRARSVARHLAWLPSRRQANVGAGFVTIGSAAAQVMGAADPLVGTFGLAAGAVAALLACVQPGPEAGAAAQRRS